MTTRRQFLSFLGATGVAAATSPGSLFGAPSSVEPFSFIFLTDTHTQPELNAGVGTDMAMKKARTLKAGFAINGGDQTHWVFPNSVRSRSSTFTTRQSRTSA